MTWDEAKQAREDQTWLVWDTSTIESEVPPRIQHLAKVSGRRPAVGLGSVVVEYVDSSLHWVFPEQLRIATPQDMLKL